MVEIEVSQVIERPAADVFAHIADMARNPEWQKGMVDCEWTSDGPLAVGSTYDQRARFLGKDILTAFEVTELEPGRHIRIVSTGGTMPLDITRTVEPVDDDSCRVTALVSGEPRGWQARLEPLMAVMVRRSVAADYRRLRQQLEGET